MEDTKRDFYSVLGIARDSSAEEIKQKFMQLALRLHPDKVASGNEGTNTSSVAVFQAVQEAYNTLRDPVARAKYDGALAEHEMLRSRIHETVRLGDMSAQNENVDDCDGGVITIFSHPCRCGGVFEITSQDICDGFSITNCDSCSLSIEVTGFVV